MKNQRSENAQGRDERYIQDLFRKPEDLEIDWRIYENGS